MQEAETPASKQFKQERSGGDYGEGTREMQSRNYISRKENERKRREMFDDALDKFKQKDIEGVRLHMYHQQNCVMWQGFERHTRLHVSKTYTHTCTKHVCATTPEATYHMGCGHTHIPCSCLCVNNEHQTTEHAIMCVTTMQVPHTNETSSGTCNKCASY